MKDDKKKKDFKKSQVEAEESENPNQKKLAPPPSKINTKSLSFGMISMIMKG